MRFLLVIFLCFNIMCFGLNLKDLSLLEGQKIRGKFAQTKILKAFEEEIIFYGEFEFSKDELFWKVQKPIQNFIKITPNGVFEERNSEWILLENNKQKSLFLDMMHLNFENLKEYFNVKLEGDKKSWNIYLTPINSTIKKIFQEIKITGSNANEFPLVKEIILQETSGDITKTEFSIIK